MLWRVDRVVQEPEPGRRMILVFAGYVSGVSHAEAWAKARVWFEVTGTILVRPASAVHPFAATQRLPQRLSVQFVQRRNPLSEWHVACEKEGSSPVKGSAPDAIPATRKE